MSKSRQNRGVIGYWLSLGPRFLPFADAATTELPLGRLLRLSLFQVSVGMAIVLLNGTLNRVMIVELDVPVWFVSLMIALPLLFAPVRALIGHRSDHHRSYLGWRRVPYIWFGTLGQFGGLAIMPFSLVLLTGGGELAGAWAGQLGAAVAFLLVGFGLHTTQTAGLALATDLAPEANRPRVVALLYVMLLVGMAGSAILFAIFLDNFSYTRLIQVIQGAAVVTMVLNFIALWQQEPRRPGLTRHDRKTPTFGEAWAAFHQGSRTTRTLVAVALGTAGFSMQDILLEPYGAEILGLGVAGTTFLTALFASGTLLGFALAARQLSQGQDPYKLAGYGALVGLFAFSAVIFSAPLESPSVFRFGTLLIGFGGGLFGVGTLCAAMAIAKGQAAGMALGVWGAVQASAAGLGLALGGFLRDGFDHLAMNGVFGAALAEPATGYSIVYHIEIGLLFATLVAVGPLVKVNQTTNATSVKRFGLDEFPA